MQNLLWHLLFTYEKEGQQFCAGFGIGDTGLVLRKAESKELIQLVYSVYQKDGATDAFDNAAAKEGIDTIIARNSVFIIPVQAGDELVGYTSLFGLEVPVDDTLLHGASAKYQLDSQQVSNAAPSLYDQVVDKNLENHANARYDAAKNKTTVCTGGDYVIGAVDMPSRELQLTLQSNVCEDIEDWFQGDIRKLPAGETKEAIIKIYEQVCSIRAKFSNEAPTLTRVLLNIANVLFQPTREYVEAYSALVKEVAERSSMTSLSELMADFKTILMVRGASIARAPELGVSVSVDARTFGGQRQESKVLGIGVSSPRGLHI